jgi:hypothetical protein
MLKGTFLLLLLFVRIFRVTPGNRTFAARTSTIFQNSQHILPKSYAFNPETWSRFELRTPRMPEYSRVIPPIIYCQLHKQLIRLPLFFFLSFCLLQHNIGSPTFHTFHTFHESQVVYLNILLWNWRKQFIDIIILSCDTKMVIRNIQYVTVDNNNYRPRVNPTFRRLVLSTFLPLIVYSPQPIWVLWLPEAYTVIPRLTSDRVNEFFG